MKVLIGSPVEASQWKLKHREALLQTLASGLNQYPGHRMGDLNVSFMHDGEVLLSLGVAQAVDYIANDLWWDADSDWSEATHVVVKTF